MVVYGYDLVDLLVVWFLGRHPIVGCFGSVWLNRASRDLLVSGETPVSCFGLILTRVDLVTQPVTYFVFGYIVTCRIIIFIVVVVVMF